MNVKSERLVKEEFKCFGQSNFEYAIVINLMGKTAGKIGIRKGETLRISVLDLLTN